MVMDSASGSGLPRIDCEFDEQHGARGVLIPLKTTLETRSNEKTVDMFFTAVPTKAAHSVLSLLRKLLPDDGRMDIQHLRRFAKATDLPSHVLSSFTVPSEELKLFLLISPTSAISLLELTSTLSSLLTSPVIFTTQVPQVAPTSQAQATKWTSMYWPTVYKKNNPFGPHPSIISRAEDEIKNEVAGWMSLAWRVAAESEELGYGEKIGVVIVERREGKGKVVAVAGDARGLGFAPANRKRDGNVMAHAILRAIGMVAQGLRKRDEERRKTTKAVGEPAQDITAAPTIFHDLPLLPFEKALFDPDGNVGGYLCHDLEIYMTHEPCVMCSMAIIHSRVGRAVFQHRMKTGGMSADGELGHGLHWRKELNWTLLGWEWKVVEEMVMDGLNA